MWFFEKINKIDKLLSKQAKQEARSPEMKEGRSLAFHQYQKETQEYIILPTVCRSDDLGNRRNLPKMQSIKPQMRPERQVKKSLSIKEIEYITNNVPKWKAADSNGVAGTFYQLCKKLSMKLP